MEPTQPTFGIERVRVWGLFDQFDYDLPPSGKLNEIVILYGDNGSGKTTLLQLLFHLLSASNTSGHRTALASMPFRKAEVRLTDGTALTAERREGQVGWPLVLSIEKPGQNRITWGYTPQRGREMDLVNMARLREELDVGDLEVWERVVAATGSISELGGTSSNTARSKLFRQLLTQRRGEQAYLECLKSLAINIYLVSSDRQIKNDKISPRELRNLVSEGEKLSNRYQGDSIASARAALAARALDDTARWISNQAVRAANEGSDSANSIYGAVVRKLSGFNFRPTEVTVLEDLVDQLGALSRRNNDYAAYEFTTAISFDEIIQDLKQSQPEQRQLVEDILKPYLDGIRARLDALRPIFETTSTFVTRINEFFTGKTLKYSLTNGFFIHDHKQRVLGIGHLSSGELQLLLLFCHTLLVRDERTIIMIDEPEISLNIKWQRQLISALKQIAHRGSVQFIFASHSIEMIADHREDVAKLEHTVAL